MRFSAEEKKKSQVFLKKMWNENVWHFSAGMQENGTLSINEEVLNDANQGLKF